MAFPFLQTLNNGFKELLPWRWGNQRAAFTGTTKINRKDFGLSWNKTLDSGNLLVGEDINITLEIEGILEK